MTASPFSLPGAIGALPGSVGQPANDRRATPPRRMLPPALRQEIAAMAAAYLRELGIEDADRRLGLALRLVERVENLPPAPRDDVMLTAFDELQRLVGEAAGATPPGQPDTAETAGRLRLFLAGGAPPSGTAGPAAEPALPLSGPVAPRLAMVPQPLETWSQRAQAMGRRLMRLLAGAPEARKTPATIPIER